MCVLLILFVCLIAVGVADRSPGVLQVTASALTLCLLAVRLHFSRRAAFTWLAGLAVMSFLLFTLLPVPRFIAGRERGKYFTRASKQLALASTPEVAPSKMPMNQRGEGVVSPGYTLAYSVPGSRGVAGLYSNSYGHYIVESAKERESEDVTGEGLASGVLPFLALKDVVNLLASPRLSLNVSGTMRCFFTFAGAWAVFWLVSSMSFHRRRLTLRVLMLVGAGLVLAGLVGFGVIKSHDLTWLYGISGDPGEALAITRSHFAALCALMSPFAAVMILSPRMHSSRKHRTGDVNESTDTLWRVAAGGSLGIFVWGCVASSSSGGLLAMVGGICIALIVALRIRPGAGVITLGIMAVIFSFVFDWSQLIPQAGSMSDLVRPRIWRAGLEQWFDYPILGAGAESTRALQAIYISGTEGHSPLYCDNEYIQLLADHGVVGVVAVSLLICSYVLTVSKHHGTGLDGGNLRPYLQVAQPVLAAGFGALAVILMQSIVDFPLRRPVVAYSAAVLLGAAMPLRGSYKRRLPSNSKEEHCVHAEADQSELLRSRWKRVVDKLLRIITSRYVLAVYAALVLGLGIAFRPPALQYDRPDFLLEANCSQLSEAISRAPSYWLPWHQFGLQVMTAAQRELKAEGVTDNTAAAVAYARGLECLRLGLDYNRSGPYVWQGYADFCETRQDWEAARAAYRHLSRMRPENELSWRRLALFELDHGSSENVLAVARNADKYLSKDDAVRFWGLLGIFAQEAGKTGVAAVAYREKHRLTPDSGKVLGRLAKMEEAEGNLGLARSALRELTELQPGAWQSWWHLGEVEIKLNNVEGASAAFARAVQLNPDLQNRAAKLLSEERKRNKQ